MFAKVRSGELSKEGFVKTLNGYQADKLELMRNHERYGAELFKSKMRDLDMSISMVELFIEKFDDIAQGPVTKVR
jgi:hypothetical protein